MAAVQASENREVERPSREILTRSEARTLLAAVFLVSLCGLIYELLLATLSSYLLGSSVLQFSLSIGIFIGSMGAGSYASQFVRNNLLRAFVLIEVALAVVGGFSASALFAVYTFDGVVYYPALCLLLLAVGSLTGIELPLLTRLINDYGGLRKTLAQALSFDYLGALIGSIAFPLVLLPMFGAVRTSFAVGLLNIAVAAYTVRVFRNRFAVPRVPIALCAAGLTVLAMGFAAADKASSWFESRLYRDQIVYSAQTRYQHLVITRWHDDLRLFINGQLQFSSMDEYRYHEALVQPAMSLTRSRENVLIIGGGDGLAMREVFKHSDVKSVTLVDLDPRMTSLGRSYPAIAALNRHSFDDPRAHVVNQDAYKFLEDPAQSALYGVIVVDLPDPNSEALAKLYSVEFYRLVSRHLAQGGVMVTQATSPYFARPAFWCILRSVEAAGLEATPYHAYVPSFGDWGFVMAAHGRKPDLADASIDVPTRFLTRDTTAAMADFDKDIAPVPVQPTTLDRPRVIDYYAEEEVRRWQ